MEISKKILLGAAASGRVSSAYLFVGKDSKALLDESVNFASVLNCESASSPCGACGECSSCSKINKGTHQDVLVLNPSGNVIKIDEIRQISEFVRFGPTSSKWKVVIVADGDRMPEVASNSFLKTLEEPSKRVLFIITTTRPAHILKTIASRCQSVLFNDEKAAVDEVTSELTETFLNISSIEIPDLLKFSEEIANMPDPAETLNAIIYDYREKSDPMSAKKFTLVKEIFSAVSALERHANKKLAIDTMLLSMKEGSSN